MTWQSFACTVAHDNSWLASLAVSFLYDDPSVDSADTSLSQSRTPRSNLGHLQNLSATDATPSRCGGHAHNSANTGSSGKCHLPARDASPTSGRHSADDASSVPTRVDVTATGFDADQPTDQLSSRPVDRRNRPTRRTDRTDRTDTDCSQDTPTERTTQTAPSERQGVLSTARRTTGD